MQAIKESLSKTVFLEDIRVDTFETLSCLQVRNKLDALFDRDSLLEEAMTDFKRSLFRHLETCTDCCRAFDVRVRFCSSGGSRIY